MWRGRLPFTFQLSGSGATAAVHSADYSRSRRTTWLLIAAASFTQSNGSPYSLDRVRKERIGLAEVEPYVLHASMSLPVFDRVDSSVVADHVIASAGEGIGAFGSRQRVLSRSIAHSVISSLRASATMAMFLRDATPRLMRCTNALAQSLRR